MSDTGKDKKTNVGGRLSKAAAKEQARLEREFYQELSKNNRRLLQENAHVEAVGLGLTDPQLELQFVMAQRKAKQSQNQSDA